MHIILIANFFLVVVFYLAFKNVSHIAFYKIETFLSVMLMFIVSFALIYYAAAIGWMTPIMMNIANMLVMCSFASRKIRILPLCVVYGLITIIIILLAGYTAGVFFNFIFGPVQDRFYIHEIMEIFLYILAVSILTYFISRWMGNYLHKKIHVFEDDIKKSFSIYLLFGACITLAMFFIKVFMQDILIEAGLLNTVYGISLGIYFVFLTLAVFSFTDNYRKDSELRNKEEIITNLHIYTDSVDNVAQEMRKFRHDHRNLMLGFYDHIRSKDLIKLEEYYEQYMSSFEESLMTADRQIDVLKNIHIPEIKSILIFKLIYAMQLNIDIYVEVPAVIEGKPNLDIVGLCRIVGILIDNAVEASHKAAKPVLRFMAAVHNGHLSLVFTNTYDTYPLLSKISENGYTTKENGRGLGLYTVSQMLDKSAQFTLDTQVDDDMFIQKLSVLV